MSEVTAAETICPLPLLPLPSVSVKADNDRREDQSCLTMLTEVLDVTAVLVVTAAETICPLLLLLSVSVKAD